MKQYFNEAMEWKIAFLSKSYAKRVVHHENKSVKEHPLTPHFYIVKLGFTGVNIFFLFLLQNIDCGYSLEPPH